MTNVERLRRVGFGCGSLMRVPLAKDRRRLLDVAFDRGIRYFDVARMYGCGQAESELGQFARDKRGEITIATKFGIQPTAAMERLARHQQFGRAVLRWFPGIRRILKQHTSRLYSYKCFSAHMAQQSLDKSLAELRTNYVDVLLLHECSETDTLMPDVPEWLEDQRSRGIILNHGFSGGVRDVCRMDELYPKLAQVLQFPNDILNRNICRVRTAESVKLVTFSPFAMAFERISRWLMECPGRCGKVSERIGVDLAECNVLSQLLFEYCIRANAQGITLFSTTKPDRLAVLSECISNSPFTECQVARFLEVVDELLAASDSGYVI